MCQWAIVLVHCTNEPLMPIFSFLTVYFYSQLLFNWKKWVATYRTLSSAVWSILQEFKKHLCFQQTHHVPKLEEQQLKSGTRAASCSLASLKVRNSKHSQTVTTLWEFFFFFLIPLQSGDINTLKMTLKVRQSHLTQSLKNLSPRTRWAPRLRQFILCGKLLLSHRCRQLRHDIQKGALHHNQRMVLQ